MQVKAYEDSRGKIWRTKVECDTSNLDHKRREMAVRIGGLFFKSAYGESYARVRSYHVGATGEYGTWADGTPDFVELHSSYKKIAYKLLTDPTAISSELSGMFEEMATYELEMDTAKGNQDVPLDE